MRPRRRGFAAVLALAGLAVGAGGAAAQLPGTQFALGTGMAAVVTLDQERLFAESAFGRAVAAAVERSARALTEENRALEEDLAREERALTERRTQLPPAEFRTLAEAFDARVQAIRRRQEGRGRAIAAFRDAQRLRFFEAAVPVVAEVVAASGAVVVLDSRAIVLALDEVDITDRVLVRLDAVLGTHEVPERVPQAMPGPVPSGDGAAVGAPLDLPVPALPGSAPPETAPPGTVPPGTAAPETAPPGAALPEIAPPGTGLPEAAPPGTGLPE
ncbi:OmpH family outer membrane protein [Rhodobaculum claviforme]|uniref:Periplasmic chaperone for outer membrane proteins Skp n=1 Tax=Rhodobaculum claviforme TaxID=1549854 RepID=A0A934TK35_9RHOB|nr:OmpH family outer membrane protein [Rhodobaculum claviforme]MBK5927574.1 hypothetical protein [Rhodobaculum claviforme]